MAQPLENNLLDMWVNADRLPVPVIRALIEELDRRRHHDGPDGFGSNLVTFSFRPDPSVLDYPLLELQRHAAQP